MCSFSVLFFFFKQKTAYEMRISDWSSDVCSSDLPAHLWRRHRVVGGRIGLCARRPLAEPDRLRPGAGDAHRVPHRRLPGELLRDPELRGVDEGDRPGFHADLRPPRPAPRHRAGYRHRRRSCPELRHRPRSEEHTSELQSLMRISYAVFCLKKKNKKMNNKTSTLPTTSTI